MRQENMRRLISIMCVVVMILIFGLTNHDFFSVGNMLNILRECGVVGIIAVGVALVIITAGIDLSTGAMIGLCGMFSNYLMYNFGVPAPVIIIVSILLGLICGAVNGFIVTKLRVPEFIGTLSTQYLFRSLVFVFAIREAGVISNKKITDMGILILGGSINGFYLVTIVFIAAVVLGQILLKKTKFGTYIYATGANRKSAELSGIPTEKVRMGVYMITGFLVGLATLFSIGRIGSVTTDLGTGLEFDVISAVVIGGCAFSGGRGDVVGAAIGAVFMAVLQNGILKYNLPTATQLIVKGVVIVIMIVFDSAYNQMMQKRIMRKAREQEEMVTGGAA